MTLTSKYRRIPGLIHASFLFSSFYTSTSNPMTLCTFYKFKIPNFITPSWASPLSSRFGVSTYLMTPLLENATSLSNSSCSDSTPDSQPFPCSLPRFPNCSHTTSQPAAPQRTQDSPWSFSFPHLFSNPPLKIYLKSMPSFCSCFEVSEHVFHVFWS